MKKIALCLVALTAIVSGAKAQNIDELLPVRGFAIEAPGPQGVDAFVRFVDEELAPAKINLLILRVDWGYAYESHPELRDPNPLSKADVSANVVGTSPGCMGTNSL